MQISYFFFSIVSLVLYIKMGACHRHYCKLLWPTGKRHKQIVIIWFQSICLLKNYYRRMVCNQIFSCKINKNKFPAKYFSEKIFLQYNLYFIRLDEAP